METQAQILQSDAFAVEVIRKLRLDQNPDLVSKNKKINEAAVPEPNPGGPQLTAREKVALGKFSGRLKVRRDTLSRLVVVDFASHDPQLAAQVANTIVDLFIEDTFQNRHNAIMKSSEWLARQLDDIRSKMETSSKALADFQGSIGVSDIDGDKSTYTDTWANSAASLPRPSPREFNSKPCSRTCRETPTRFPKSATIPWSSN